MNWLRRFWHAREGSVIVMGAMSLVSVLGMSGLAVEIGSGYAAKVTNQRVADVAALGALLAYQASNDIGKATQTAKDIAAANGVTSNVAAKQVTVGTTQAIQVDVTTTVPIKLASVLTKAASYQVSDTAVAALTGGAGCIVALGNGTAAISASGGASVSASGCGINTNGTIKSDNSSAKITAKSITAYGISDAAAAYGQNAVTTNPLASNWILGSRSASDYVKDNNPAVKAILCQVNALTGTSDSDYKDGNSGCADPVIKVGPVTSSSTTDWTTGWGAKTASGFDSYTDGHCNYTVPAGIYDVRNLTVAGGCSISFANGSTLKFASINMSGADMKIGNGDLTVTGTFTVNGNNAVTIGNGSHYFGALAIGGGKKLDVGSGNFSLYGSISVSGGAYLRVNTAMDNVVAIGSNGSATAISIGGGSQVCFTADCTTPTAAAGTFSANGNVSVDGGGSLFVFPKAQLHVIKGDFTATAGVIFGPGSYVIKGNFTNVTGDGSSNGMRGSDITLALGGTFNFGGGAYYDLAAPTSATGTSANGAIVGYGIADVLLVTKTSAATTISAGANGKVSGLIYAPKSALSSSGGSSISNKGSACMMVVVQSVTVTGSGTVSTANCGSVASWAGNRAALIQ